MGQNWELASNGKYMKQSSQDSPKSNPQERNTAAMDSALDRPDELVGETIFLIRSGQELLSSLRVNLCGAAYPHLPFSQT